MDEIEEVVLTLTPYEAAVLRRLLDATVLMATFAPIKRFPADQVLIDINGVLAEEGVPVATYNQCRKGNLNT